MIEKILKKLVIFFSFEFWNLAFGVIQKIKY